MTFNEAVTSKDEWIKQVKFIASFEKKARLDLADKFLEGREQYGLDNKEIAAYSGYKPNTVSTYISVASTTIEHRVDDPNHHLTFSIYKRARAIVKHYKKSGQEQDGIDLMREMLMEYRDACDDGVYHDEKGDECFPSPSQFSARVDVIIGKEVPHVGIRTAKGVGWKTVYEVHQMTGKPLPESYMQAPYGTEFDVMITTIAKYPQEVNDG